MPLHWHIATAVAVLLWAILVYLLAHILPAAPGTLSFIGTVLTLLPAIHELLKRYYLRTRSPAPPPDEDQQSLLRRTGERARTLLSGFNPAYALLLLLGVTLISAGFLRQSALGW